jgi:hypothetical protein
MQNYFQTGVLALLKKYLLSNHYLDSYPIKKYSTKMWRW